MRKKLWMSVFVLVMALSLTACGNKGEVKDKEDVSLELEQVQAPKSGEEVAVIETNHGVIKARLFDEVAPKAVENFKTHVKDGYYDGVIFHRVIEDFMIQGGDPDGTGMGGESIWGEPFEDEFDINYRNIRGALSMANAGPGTNGSQFFIVQVKSVDEDIIGQMRDAGEENGFPKDVVDAYEALGGSYSLDGKHAVFGQVYEGMDVVDKIAAVKVGENDKPEEDVVMKKVYLEKIK